MTGNNLIVLAPWIIFGAGLTAIFLRLLRSRHLSRPRPASSDTPQPQARDDPGGNLGAVPRCTEQAAGCGQHGATSS